MNTPYLSIQNLEKNLQAFHLGPINLNLNKQDYLVLLGSTGCGKTSLLKCLTGHYGKVKGNIFLAEKNISQLSINKKEIGYVSQTVDLFPHLTTIENLSYGLKYSDLSVTEKKKRLEKYLNLFDLENFAYRKPYTLSGGESKRLAISRSLITEPKLLLLDEPLSMLDYNARLKMLDVLKMIHETLKTTIIHVTHDRYEAWSIAKKCSVMCNGKIFQTGNVSDVFRKPTNLFTAEFLGGTNIFKAEFKNDIANVPWGTVKLPSPTSFPNGWIVIRPENINLVRENLPHKIKGIVQSVHDFGIYIEIQICVNENHCVVAHSCCEDIMKLKKGGPVFMEWNDESVWLFE
ncbi:ABC transporter ATP-binding protein [bacterium]